MSQRRWCSRARPAFPCEPPVQSGGILEGSRTGGPMPFRWQEYLCLYHLSKWEDTAPPDKHMGTLAGRGDVKNTQTARMSRLLTLVVAVNPADMDASFEKLIKRTQRKDGNSYISKDKSWMTEPYEIA